MFHSATRYSVMLYFIIFYCPALYFHPNCSAFSLLHVISGRCNIILYSTLFCSASTLFWSTPKRSVAHYFFYLTQSFCIVALHSAVFQVCCYQPVSLLQWYLHAGLHWVGPSIKKITVQRHNLHLHLKLTHFLRLLNAQTRVSPQFSWETHRGLRTQQPGKHTPNPPGSWMSRAATSSLFGRFKLRETRRKRRCFCREARETCQTTLLKRETHFRLSVRASKSASVSLEAESES